MPPTGDCGIGRHFRTFQQRPIAEFRETLSTTPFAQGEGGAFDDSEVRDPAGGAD